MKKKTKMDWEHTRAHHMERLAPPFAADALKFPDRDGIRTGRPLSPNAVTI